MGRAEDLFEVLEARGEAAIDELIATRKSEELFLDFKRSSDNGGGTRLSSTDRNNLAKAISGFGNSEGGVVVWGVECSPDQHGADVASSKVPLVDAPKFVTWLENVVSGATVPPHPLVRSITIGGSFAATLIPSSHVAPHQTVQPPQYYIRAGSSFAPTPHAVLAGMFGRRPLPHVFHQFVSAQAEIADPRITFKVGILIRNQGPGIATDLYLNLTFVEVAKGGSHIRFEVPNEDAWTWQKSFGIDISVISKAGIRLPPEAHLQPLLLQITLCAPFESGIRAAGMVGAGNSPPYRFEFNASRESLERLYHQTLTAHGTGTLTPEQLSTLPSLALGVESEHRN